MYYVNNSQIKITYSGKGLRHWCSKSVAVENITNYSEELGSTFAEQVASGKFIHSSIHVVKVKSSYRSETLIVSIVQIVSSNRLEKINFAVKP